LNITDRSGFETLKNFAYATRFNNWLYKSVSSACTGEVLEIGSGIGNISDYLCNSGLPITLSDSRIEYCDILKERFSNSIRVLQIDISTEKFEHKYSTLIGTFDTVILLNVLEHIENESLTLINCKRLLTREGRLVILVPAFQKLYNALDKNLGHIKRYNKTSLRKEIEVEGFQVKRLMYFNCSAILGWWFAGTVMKHHQLNLQQLKLFDFFVPAFRIIDFLFNPFFGISIIAVAENKYGFHE